MPDHFTICIISSCSMRLIHHNADHISGITSGREQVILKRLRCHVKNAFRAPFIISKRALSRSSQFNSGVPRKAANAVACLLLLRYKGSCRGHKNNFSLWIPAKHVEYHDSCDESFPQPGWKSNENIAELVEKRTRIRLSLQYLVGKYAEAC